MSASQISVLILLSFVTIASCASAGLREDCSKDRTLKPGEPLCPWVQRVRALPALQPSTATEYFCKCARVTVDGASVLCKDLVQEMSFLTAENSEETQSLELSVACTALYP